MSADRDHQHYITDGWVSCGKLSHCPSVCVCTLSDCSAHVVTEQERYNAVADAYDPDECESCDVMGTTCWECAGAALDGLFYR